MNWGAFAVKLPSVILGAMQIVEKVKSAKGPEKKAAVLDHVDEAIELAEFAAGRDVFNDAALLALRDQYIHAEALVLNARRDAARIVSEAVDVALQAKRALEAGLLAKKAA